MNYFLSNTFGGLTRQYYFRQLFFGLIFGGLAIWTTIQSNNPSKISLITFLSISTLLYPYSRFVYEGIINFIVGDRTIYAGGVLFFISLYFKVVLMAMCFILAILIAPIGLLYLYFR
jgi:hypothetical protein